MYHTFVAVLFVIRRSVQTRSIIMTPFKNFGQYPSWKHRVRRGGLYVAVAALLAANTGCGDSGNGSDWEEVTVQEPTKGVVTTLEETEPGKFSIVDEAIAESRDASRVVIKRLSGTTDTLTLAQAQALVQPQDTAGGHNTATYRHSHGMGSVLWWGTMGYMMGRSFGSPSYNGYYSPGFTSRSVTSELQRTAVSRTVTRPVSGKSGFFKGWGRASGG